MSIPYVVKAVRLWCACVAVLGGIAAHGAAAIETRPNASATIESTSAAIETSALEEADRQLALARLDRARTDEREEESLRKQLEDLRAEAAAQPARMDRLREALALDRDQALQEWAARLPRSAEAETLERVLEQERNIIAQLGAQLDGVAGDLLAALSGPARTASEIAGLRRRAAELSAPASPVPGEAALLAQTRELRRASELHRVQTELELLQLKQDSATNRQRLNELTLSELHYREELHMRRVELLQARIVDLGRSEMESRIARLVEIEATYADQPGIAAGAATENRELGDDLIAQNELLARDRNALTALERSRDRVAESLRDARARLELAGTSEAVGRWLWSERRRLEAPARLRRDLETQRGTLAELRLRMVMLSEQQRGLVDIPAAAQAMAEAVQNESDEAVVAEPATERLQPLLAERVELLALLEPLLERRIAALERSDRVLGAQLDDTLALRQLLDRHLLWAPSHAPLDASWLRRVPEGIREFVRLPRLQTTAALVGREVVDRPIPWLASLVLLLALAELRRRAPRQIEAQAAATRQVRKDSYWTTMRAFAWTLLAALPGPAALGLIGELLQSVGSPGRYSDSLGRACTTLVLPLLAVQVLRWTAVERGLGHAHFRWLQARRDALRRTLPLAASVVLSMCFVAALAFIRNLDLPNDVQARLAIVIACCAIAWALWRLLDVGQLWVVRGEETEPSTTRKLLRVTTPALVLFVAGLAVAGYVYTAGMLTRPLLATFTLVVAVSIGSGLLARWFLLGERRLAWQRLQDRAAAAAQAADAADEQAPDAEADVTLEQVNAQTRRLLRTVRLTLVAAGLLWVWSDVMPAIARLEEITLWQVSGVGADGTPIMQPVTLMGALFGAFALAITVGGARNLPGLIEIGLLSYTRIDAGSRYAITSILRYAIVIFGTVIGLGLLGMHWSQLQWLAAALTVGLGFGLQEIFANFVSGLILLFERPFRVGDVITVADLSGRVTRIRTRATTILDFDNKEIVVPNKSFITGQLINWTLSDTTTRIAIKVGVAYGTNPRRVHELLQQAAHENSLVLTDPEPLSWFLAFGASSLDFELRVFVAAIVDRLRVQDELNTRIAELFAEQNIQIAFPQLDLHVRDVPAELRSADPGTPGAGG